MKILAFEHVPSTQFGGSERSYLDVLTGLRNKGHQVTLYYHSDGNLLQNYSSAGIELVKVKTPYMFHGGRKLKDLVWMLAALRSFGKKKGAIVYLNFIEALPLAAILKAIFGFPFVCHVRLGLGEMSRQFLWSGRKASGFIVINSRQKEECERVFGTPANQIHVISNGVSIPDVLMLPRRQTPSPIRILYLGRLTPEKGVVDLVCAVSELQRLNIPFQLQLTGNFVSSYDGDFQKELNELVRREQLSSSVSISPAVDDPISYMAGFDLFVFPSTWETFGRTVPEAILAGIPVIARKVGMVEEIMADNRDFLFDTGQELSHLLVQFAIGAIHFRIEEARARVVREFNSGLMVGRIESALKQLLLGT